MTRPSRLPLALCLALAIFASAAYAAGNGSGQDNPVRQAAEQVRAALAAGEYPDLTSAEHRRALELANRMEAQMGSASSVDELTQHARVRLFNDQQELNAILTGVDANDRLVCTRMRVSGTHRRQNVCVTAAERDERRELNKQQLNRYRQQNTR